MSLIAQPPNTTPGSRWRFPVEVVRSTRRTKTISMQVVSGRLVVRAPARTSRQVIDRLITQNRERIEQWLSVADPSSKQPWYERPLPMNGRHLTLFFHSSHAWTFEAEADTFHISGPVATIADARVKQQLENWLVQQANSDLCDRVAQWSARTGIDYVGIRVKSQKSRWGSCSSQGNLNFNWRLIMAPEYVRDYVVVHELCHRLEMNHSKKFWDHVAKHIQDHKNAREWLKTYGQTLYF